MSKIIKKVLYISALALCFNNLAIAGTSEGNKHTKIFEKCSNQLNSEIIRKVAKLNEIYGQDNSFPFYVKNIVCSDRNGKKVEISAFRNNKKFIYLIISVNDKTYYVNIFNYYKGDFNKLAKVTIGDGFPWSTPKKSDFIFVEVDHLSSLVTSPEYYILGSNGQVTYFNGQYTLTYADYAKQEFYISTAFLDIYTSPDYIENMKYTTGFDDMDNLQLKNAQGAVSIEPLFGGGGLKFIHKKETQVCRGAAPGSSPGICVWGTRTEVKELENYAYLCGTDKLSMFFSASRSSFCKAAKNYEFNFGDIIN
ncbi:hypothetical protein [Francisella frigiditurris]|uniref:Uncharacterized protein n=1 Tax=Francisella frigiditurris TaxID=1542390 RepID=A0A1J0KV00_9GAMM|nr:hypothetical protein [Francisella frigiditurris]APC97613.1 hypothetical protein KX01_1236 [Francisella frigiditurris]